MDQRLKILVAEDNELIQRMLLEILPYDVRVASNGEQCLEMLKGEEFDLLLLDIILPRVSGVALLRIVKEKYPELAVVVMTGFADTVRGQILALGVDGFIEKPFQPDEVLSAIQKAMGRRRKAGQDT